MFKIITLLIVSLCTINLFSQEIQLTNWEAYTSMYNVNSLHQDGNKIYAATSGGVYFADLNTNSIEQFTNVTGLSRIEARFITHQIESDKVFVGYNDGVFDIYENGNWKAIYDIQNAGFVKAYINEILPDGDKLYISGGFGLVVFNHKENVTIEDVKRFGDLNIGTEARTIKIHDNKIWLATSAGVVYADLDNSLANRSDWKSIIPSEPFHDADILDIEWVNDSLYATSGDRIYSWDGESLKSVFEYPTKDIFGLDEKNGTLYFFREKDIRDYPKDVRLTKVDFPINEMQFALNSDDVYLATKSGLKIAKQDTTLSIEPNSPLSNGIAHIHVTKEGSLWIGTGNFTGNGVMSFRNGVWDYYNRSTNPEFEANSVINVNELKDGTITASTYGGGLYLIPPGDNVTIENITAKNSPLIGTGGSGNFVITGDVFDDEFGNLWIVNWGNSGSGPLFVVRTPSGNFETLFNCAGSTRRVMYKTAIDFNGTKWIASAGTDVTFSGTEVAVGLAYYNEMRTLSDKSDDVCGMFTVNNSSIISNNQQALAFDKQGTLWIGTIGGVNRIINPSAVMNNGTPIFVNIRSLANTNVREIVVDALDNKWIATANGLIVIDPDGENVLLTITTDNSPLPTNNLYALAYDENSGKMYIGTDKGLYSVQTNAVKPIAEYDLKVYPQPFDTKKNKLMTIEGLAENSDLRIVTVNGELVRALKVNSRKTTWDGKNERGEDASPGVYLLYAVSSTTESTQVIKFAIVNK
jgi:ligand-binding sensor domain-containing protein